MVEPIVVAIVVEAKDMLEKFNVTSMHIDDDTLVIITDKEVTILIHPAQALLEQGMDLV